MQFGGWELREITERIVYLELRGRLRMAEWLELVAEFDCRDGRRRTGFRSTAEWLAFTCRLSGRTARDHVRVARRLGEWRAVADAFGEGRISYAQVRALTRADEGEDERALLKVALTSTAAGLERHVRQLRSSPSVDEDVARRTRSRRFLTHLWEEDGSLRFFGSLPAVEGAAFVEAIETAAEAIWADQGGCEEDAPRPSLAARRADALVELVGGDSVRAQVVLHVDVDSLACEARGDEPRAGEVCFLRDGPAIPSALARRLTCDADVSVKGLNLGRTQRTVTPAQRRALEARDGRVCSMPGCDRTHGLVAHHLRHWIHGGRTDLINLALFCRFHHHQLHDGFNARRRRDGTLLITDPRGREVLDVPARASPLLVAA